MMNRRPITDENLRPHVDAVLATFAPDEDRDVVALALGAAMHLNARRAGAALAPKILKLSLDGGRLVADALDAAKESAR